MVATHRLDDRSGPVEVRLEYVKRRKVLRLWSEQTAPEPIEVHRTAVLEALGDDPEPEGQAPRFLLVAGIPAPSGGDARPLVTTFEYEDQARAAFQALRMRAYPKTAWAQVVSLTGRGRPRPVCWFGTSSASRPDAPVSEVKPAVRRWRTWPRRSSELQEQPSAPGSLSPQRARRAASRQPARNEPR